MTIGAGRPVAHPAVAEDHRRAAAPGLVRFAPWVLGLIVLQMTVSLLLAASWDAPTYDETTHVASGILNVREHDLRWNAEHPPLVKILAGVTTASEPVRIPRGSEAYRAGDPTGTAHELLYGAGIDGRRLVHRARLPMIALTVAFAFVVFGFARDLFGVAGGLVAAALYAHCPTVLGHGHVVHADIAVAGFLLTTAWFLRRAETRGSRWLVAASVAFGLALATKFTALVAVPPVLAVAAWGGFRSARGDASARAMHAVARAGVMVVGSLSVLWLSYLAVSPTLRFRPDFYAAIAGQARGVMAWVADVLPVPGAYRVGLRFALAFDQFGHRPAFLFGEPYLGGQPLFYPAVLLAKTPIPSLLLWAGGFSAAVRSRRDDVLRALLPIPLAVLGLSLVSQTNIGIRHVAVVPVFGAVVAGAVLARPSRRAHVLVAVLVLLTALSVWRAFPSQISYVNEAFGGPRRAHELFADSNVDWGQDLARLAGVLAERPPPGPLWLLYFGTAEPSAYGIEARDLRGATRDEVHGTVAVSVSWLNLAPQRWSWIAEGREPIARVGDSILLYAIP